MLGWGAVRERAVGVVTMVLMAEMEERGHIRIQEPTTPQQGITRSLFRWTCAELRDDKGPGVLASQAFRAAAAILPFEVAAVAGAPSLILIFFS